MSWFNCGSGASRLWENLDGASTTRWKRLVEDGPFEAMLVNARHVKNLPGRKSYGSDAAWLAETGRGHDPARARWPGRWSVTASVA